MTEDHKSRRTALTRLAVLFGLVSTVPLQARSQPIASRKTEGDDDVTKLSTGGYYEVNHNYSRALMIDNWIFMANTAGKDPVTDKFPDDPIEQAKFTIDKIERSLAELGSSLSDVVRYVAFIPDRKNIMPVMAYVSSRFKGINPAVTLLCTPLGSDDYKIEIEVTAFRGAGNRRQRLIERKF